MTVVICLIEEDNVYMASDGANSSDYITISETNKKFQELSPGFWIGSAGLSSMKTILKHGFKFPDYYPINQSFENYLLHLFIPEFKEYCKINDYLTENEHGFSQIESDFLIYHDKKIFYLSNDFDLTIIENDYLAIGTGKLFAMTSLYESEEIMEDGSKYTPEYRLRKAVRTAMHFDMACGGRVYVERIVAED